MKERPILFSGPMVRALLAGTKTMTRRVVKPQPHGDSPGVYADPYNHGPEWAFWLPDGRMTEPRAWHCPYGQPGDRLWVREKFWIAETSREGYGVPCLVYGVDGWDGPYPIEDRAVAVYSLPLDIMTTDILAKFGPHPSIHMPRAASRIALEVVAVRVERLHDISEEDARAEGVSNVTAITDLHGRSGPLIQTTYREAFWHLWDRINGKRPGCACGDNPWVWVVEFKRLPAPAAGGEEG